MELTKTAQVTGTQLLNSEYFSALSITIRRRHLHPATVGARSWMPLLMKLQHRRLPLRVVRSEEFAASRPPSRRVFLAEQAPAVGTKSPTVAGSAGPVRPRRES